ncbi:MAG: TonB-dependent receptor [Bacteroidales bacterium]|nr:TonB-dependent receptor [Bacteroidales bacterium]
MKEKLMMLFACLFLSASVAMAQSSSVKGTVLSAEDGEPVIGASVAVKGEPTLGTITDVDGKFTLTNLPSTAKTLVIMYLGMETQEVAIKPVVTVKMEASSIDLDEVVQVAFGTAKKSQFTGSAATLKAEKIAQRQVSSLANALSGQLAGVQTLSSNGEPGASASVVIRGIGSMAASNSPLYVVDGMPYDGVISAINPQDIESMTVLKDAASNALYGARGANGVILITTKKGQAGAKAKIDADAKWGSNRRAIPNYDVLTSTNEYYETVYSAIDNALGGSDPATVGAYVESFLKYPIYTVPEGENLFVEGGKINPNATIGAVYAEDYYLTPDNWYDELFMNDNMRQEYNVRVSGATPQSSYFMSAGYLDDTGIIPQSGFKRFNTRMNADYQVNKKVKVGGSFNYTNTNSLSPRDQSGSSSGNLFYIANRIAPIYPLYVRDAEGNIMTDSHGFTMYDFGAGEYPGLGRPFMGNSNPASMIALDKYQTISDAINGRGFLNWDIFGGLKASANFGVDLTNQRTTNLYNSYYGQYSDVGGIIYVTAVRQMSVNQQYLLSYTKDFGEHSIDALAGYEAYQRNYSYLNGSKENLYNPNITEIDNAISQPKSSSYSAVYTSLGYFARLQYDYADKYFLSGSFRRDSSSRFHPDNRWGNFWSVGAGWLINKEAFLASASNIDMLKFKVSYGVQGNDNLGYSGLHNYNYYSDHYSVADSNGDFALSLSFKGNKDLTWESSHNFNTGFDFGFFKNRVRGTVEYFSRKTVDMLYERPVAPSLGYTALPMNIGSMQNSGYELELGIDLIRTKNIVWSVNGNATTVKNKILELHPDLEGEWISGNYIYTEGESYYNMYLREYAGVDAETGSALYYIDTPQVDEAGQPILDAEGNQLTTKETTDVWSNATRYATGDILPKLYGGFGTNLNVYGFDFGISFAYQLGGRIYDNTYAALMHEGRSSNMGSNWHRDILNAWTPDNTDTDVPMLNYSGQGYANSLSTRFLTSSDYLSINNITFGYTLPKSVVKAMGIQNLRLYVAADNVAVFAARQGLDPRQGYSASGNDIYSPMKTVSGGITMTF